MSAGLVCECSVCEEATEEGVTARLTLMGEWKESIAIWEANTEAWARAREGDAAEAAEAQKWVQAHSRKWGGGAEGRGRAGTHRHKGERCGGSKGTPCVYELSCQCH